MRSFAPQAETSEALLSAKHSNRRSTATPSRIGRDASISGSQLYEVDFSKVPLHAGTGVSAPSVTVRDKDPDPRQGSGSGTARGPAPPAPTPAPAAPAAPVKRAGVDSFTVTWKKEPSSGASKAQFRIDFRATFKNDATHDPALADFRQHAFHKMKITAGPNRNTPPEDNSPIHDDGYTRADDVNSNPATGTLFEGYDNPGTKEGSLDKDDVLDYSFTAEQVIIDTSDNNKEIAKKGPHTATITGKHPRSYNNVPKTL